MSAAVDRLRGFRGAVRDAGAPPPAVAFGSFTRESGERATAELLDREPELDGVFVANDLMALGALTALKAAGRRIPDDVAVVGFDDVELAQHAEPPLTTVRQPIAEQARLMVEILVRRIGGATDQEPVVLPTELVERASG
jgi:DNA-binding LacI/PurR family transcriptional regulator